LLNVSAFLYLFNEVIKLLTLLEYFAEFLLRGRVLVKELTDLFLLLRISLSSVRFMRLGPCVCLYFRALFLLLLLLIICEVGHENF